MIKAYLDTNVLVDYFAQRQNFFVDATTIVSLAINKKIKLYVSALSFATASYLMEKHYHNNTAAIKLAISSFIKFRKLCFYPPHRPSKVILLESTRAS